MVADIQEVQWEFARKNLETLSNSEVPKPPSTPREMESNSCGIALAVLKQWSEANMDSIQKAIDQQVFGAKQAINWHTAFLPFMESMAMYLRDWTKVEKAWTMYRKWKLSEANDRRIFEDAISTYLDAFSEIVEVANLWGLDFTPLCDLSENSPETEPEWDGPFCGAFITTSIQKRKPFIGVAFKGTNPLNTAEVNVDYSYQLTTAEGYLNNQQVSLGVYTGLFKNFQAIKTIPINLICEELAALAKMLPNTSQRSARTHLTGHSLGGSYSSLCYAQLLIFAKTQPGIIECITMGDEYTFGSPRVGSKQWAVMNSELVGAADGQSWRIVNDDDVVTKVPPTDLKPDLDFCHIDTGMQIFSNQVPKELDSEQTLPQPEPYTVKDIQDFINVVLTTEYHLPNAYYESMKYAITESSK